MESLKVIQGGAVDDAADEPMDENPENLWNVRRTARFLDVSESWVYRAAESGRLPSRKLLGGARRFVPADLRAWLASQPGHGVTSQPGRGA